MRSIAAALGLAAALAAPPLRGAEPAGELMAVDRAFSALSAEKGTAAAFAAYLAPGALSLPAGGLPEKGRETIVDGLRKGDPRERLTWAPEAAEVAASGDLGFTWGFYRLTVPAATGAAPVHEGKYVTIWRKQPDGRWRAILDTGNANPP
jgi:ketosteroid isomerase-like protein